MGKAIVSESVSTLADVDDLINAGKFHAAEHTLREMQDHSAFKRSPDFWFRILLVSNLLNRPLKDIEDLHERVQTYKGWTEDMETDYQRDIILRRIRDLGILYTSPMQVALIERLIDSGVRRTCDDPNRQASFTAARARLLIAHGKFREAADACAHADEQWMASSGANEQWMRNNRFHWLIAVRRQISTKDLLWSNLTPEGRARDLDYQVRHLLDGVIHDPEERNVNRKMMAHAIFSTGRLGHLVYRVIAKYHH